MSKSDQTLGVNLTGCRNVTIRITNRTSGYDLIDPKRFYLFSGKSCSYPQPTISPQKTKSCSFCMITGLARGAVGVLTYKLFKRECSSAEETVAIMFSVPFNRNLYENWVAIGIFAGDQECDQALYNEMYNDAPYKNKDMHGFVRKKAKNGGLTFEGSSRSHGHTVKKLYRFQSLGSKHHRQSNEQLI